MRHIWIGLGATPALAFAGSAMAQPFGKQLCCGAKFLLTFNDASPDVKFLVVLLFVVAVTAVIVWFRAMRRLAKMQVARVERSLAFLASWQKAGPLLAAASAAYLQMNFFVALYSYDPVPNYLIDAFAPGLAEAAMVLGAGFLAGGIAALTHGDLTGRLQAITYADASGQVASMH